MSRFQTLLSFELPPLCQGGIDGIDGHCPLVELTFLGEQGFLFAPYGNGKLVYDPYFDFKPPVGSGSIYISPRYARSPSYTYWNMHEYKRS